MIRNNNHIINLIKEIFFSFLITPIIFLLVLNAYSQNYNWIIYDSLNSGIPAGHVWDISIDANGDKWVCVTSIPQWLSPPIGGGLAKFDGTNWTVFATSNSGLPGNSVRTIAIDTNDIKWIGIQNGSYLVKFDGINWNIFDTSNSPMPFPAGVLSVFAQNSQKWIGTYSGGLVYFDDTNWTVYNTSNSGLPNDYVFSINIDSFGNKWIGTSGGGLAKFNDTNWTIYNTSNSGIPSNFIGQTYIDKSGIKWIATTNGLAKFNDTSWTVYDTSNSGLPDNTITAIAIDDLGNKWIGTDDSGLVKFDGVNWTVFNTSNTSFPSNGVHSINIDDSQNIWIGLSFGMAVYYTESLQPTANFTIDSIDINRVYFTNISDSACCYKWFFGDGDSSLLENPLFHIYSDSGLYYITLIAYNIANNSDTIIKQVQITQLPGCSSITDSIISSNVTCNGDSNGETTIYPFGGNPPYTYYWSNGQTTQTATNLIAGTYSVIVTDFYGCIVTDSVNISEPDSILITSNIDPASQGNNDGAIYLTIIGGAQPYSFLWSNGDTTKDLDSILADTYIVLVTDSLGCIDSASILVPEITGIKQSSLINTGLKVYPNPNDGNFKINYQLSKGQKGELTIFNIMGKKLFTYPLVNEMNSLKISKSGVLKNGLYFYQIIINDNIVRREKLLIIK